MLKNDTLKNGTFRIGLYGSAPPPPDCIFSARQGIMLSWPDFVKENTVSIGKVAGEKFIKISLRY